MSARSRMLVVVVIVVAGCGGADEPIDTEIEIATASPTATATPGEEGSSPPVEPGDAATFEATVDDVDLQVDVSGEHDLVRRADELRAAVDGPETTFVVGRVDNRGDAPVTLQSIEITAGGDVITFTPAGPVVRELRSAVDLYDTETYQQATELLDAVEAEIAAAPGASSEQLFAADGRLTTIEDIVAVGTFGREQLFPR